MFYAIITDTNGEGWETQRWDSKSELRDYLETAGWVNGITGNIFFINPKHIVSMEIMEENE